MGLVFIPYRHGREGSEVSSQPRATWLGRHEGQASSPGHGPEPTLLKVTSAAFLWGHRGHCEHHTFSSFLSFEGQMGISLSRVAC